MMQDLLSSNLRSLELEFMLVGQTYGPEIESIYNHLLEDRMLDDYTLGFWVLDCRTGKELYSPGFRESLGGWTKEEFPDHESSWKLTIKAKDRVAAIQNYIDHIESKSRKAYEQIVTYNRKDGGEITLVCHGLIVCWDKEVPLTMIGVHLPVQKEYKNKD